MTILPVLFWTILVLAALGFFAPASWVPGRYLGGGATLVLFIIVGLRLFRVPLSIVLALLMLPGCLNTQTGNPATDKRHRIENAVGAVAAQVVWNFALNSAENFVAGNKGQNAAQVAFASVQKIDGAAALQSIITAAAGPKLGQVAAEAYVTANPQTKAEKVMVINSIGAALQTASASGSGVFDGRP